MYLSYLLWNKKIRLVRSHVDLVESDDGYSRVVFPKDIQKRALPLPPLLLEPHRPQEKSENNFDTEPKIIRTDSQEDIYQMPNFSRQMSKSSEEPSVSDVETKVIPMQSYSQLNAAETPPTESKPRSCAVGHKFNPYLLISELEPK